MIKKLLTRLAVRYLGLVTNTPQAPETLPQVIEANMALVKERDHLAHQVRSMEIAVESTMQAMRRITAKYPIVWLQGDVAQGVVQLPHLKMAVEFFREENKFCVFAPWNDASGRKPADFVPPWLEVDETLQIESIIDRMNGTGVVFKIPIKGWDDTIELTRKAEDDHPNYSLDGKLIEKTRSFRNRLGMNGTFRREGGGETLYCIVLYSNDQINKPHYDPADLLPKGNLRYDPSRDIQMDKFGCPTELWIWKIPVTEVDLPKLGYRKTPALSASKDA